MTAVFICLPERVVVVAVFDVQQYRPTNKKGPDKNGNNIKNKNISELTFRRTSRKLEYEIVLSSERSTKLLP